ncbi:MAG TPA: hypothetical protein EYH06_10985 [Chromatiales bacterium]|nr:hypothetical protein [Thiotrichales bacterium]HIP69088.1 hypothetical protein [Chromatiales bacterium]
MTTRKKYRKKADSFIIAVQLNLETDGFKYQKWGAEQYCKKGDWIVENSGETYTVDNKVFQKTYRKIDSGKYVKTTPVWAEVATESGSVPTKEGESHYKAGDYLVYNNEDGTDAYCISAEKFKSMYEPAD